MATIILKFDLLIDCLVFPFFVLRTPVKTASLVSGDARCCQSNFHQKFQSLHWVEVCSVLARAHRFTWFRWTELWWQFAMHNENNKNRTPTGTEEKACLHLHVLIDKVCSGTYCIYGFAQTNKINVRTAIIYINFIRPIRLCEMFRFEIKRKRNERRMKKKKKKHHSDDDDVD